MNDSHKILILNISDAGRDFADGLASAVPACGGEVSQLDVTADNYEAILDMLESGATPVVIKENR